SQRSNEDEVYKISTSVISKEGKRFGFVPFIKVFDVERLVNNLCTVWIGRHRIHANVARFQRASLNNSSNQFRHNRVKRNNISDVNKDTGVKDSSSSYAHAVKGGPSAKAEVDSNPALVMIEFLLEEVKKKFQANVRIGNVHWVRAKEVPGWVLNFAKQNDKDNESDDENFEGKLNEDNLKVNKYFEGDDQKNEVPKTVFEEDLPKSCGEDSVRQNVMQSEDPFNIYSLLKKKKEGSKEVLSTNDSLKYPLGFTPREDVETNVECLNRGIHLVVRL
nr:nucleotide-binding alpha-beta plait domain-containing protein [Tanacetum cinerariifolium]